MSDQPETPSNSRNSHENVGAKKVTLMLPQSSEACISLKPLSH